MELGSLRGGEIPAAWTTAETADHVMSSEKINSEIWEAKNYVLRMMK